MLPTPYWLREKAKDRRRMSDYCWMAGQKILAKKFRREAALMRRQAAGDLIKYQEIK